jgi:predicted transcriptional regulator of viral defense system
MPERSVLELIAASGKPVFTTFELAALGGRSGSATTQALSRLERRGVIRKIKRGIWALAGDQRATAFAAIPYLFARDRAYVSFISALHLHGIVGQIPRVITLASPAHSRTIVTSLGTYSVHRIAPSFFAGFGWYKGSGSFLIAEPEKALVDSLYLSARKKRQYGHFPELEFPKSFSFGKAREWAKLIPDSRIRANVEKKLAAIAEAAGRETRGA